MAEPPHRIVVGSAGDIGSVMGVRLAGMDHREVVETPRVAGTVP